MGLMEDYDKGLMLGGQVFGDPNVASSDALGVSCRTVG